MSRENLSWSDGKYVSGGAVGLKNVKFYFPFWRRKFGEILDNQGGVGNQRKSVLLEMSRDNPGRLGIIWDNWGNPALIAWHLSPLHLNWRGQDRPAILY